MMPNPLQVFSTIRTLTLIFTGLGLLFSLSFLFQHSGSNSDSIPFGATTERLGIFEKYNDQIYASVPSNGDYLIPEADVKTFYLPNDDYHYRQLGADKRHVYCGNILLKDVQPQHLKILGNGYFTDGKETWYCSPMTERNEDLGVIQEVGQIILQNFSLGTKPQSYLYPYFKLEQGDQPYQVNADLDTVSNGKLTYFRGKQLLDAHPHQLRLVSGEENHVFRADGKNVYYYNTLLSLKDNQKLHTLAIENLNNQSYLFNPIDGMVYVNQFAFDPQYAPYHLLSKYGDHSNHALFYNDTGIYYFDSNKGKMLRAGDNPFLDHSFKEIAPSIFSDGQQLLYLQASVYRAKKGSSSSKMTRILKLDEPLVSTWQQLGNVNYNSGSVWKNGNAFYYFDQLGDSQLIRATVYHIRDPQTIQSLLKTQPRTDDIRQWIDEQKMVEAKHTTLVEANTENRSDKYWAFIMPLIFVVIFSTLIWLFKRFNLNFAPFYIRNHKLIVCNLTMTSYPLTQIQQVEFRISSSTGTKDHMGHFRIVQHNGKRSMNFNFSSKLSLKSDSKAELNQYIEQLQKQLALHGIQSTLKK
jgi:hypothetical protein